MRHQPRHLMRPQPGPGGYVPPPGGDSGRPPFSVVFAITGTTTYEDADAAYTGHEVWVYGDGTVLEVENGHVLTASQPGVPLDGATFDVDADPPPLALARLGPGAGGRVWELAAIGASAAGAATACRAMLVGLAADSCLTGTIPAGVGKCANVEATTVTFGFDGEAGETAGGWVSTEFETRAGDTTATVFVDDLGEVRVTLTDGSNTRYMTFEGCSGGAMKFVTFDCLWCGPDDWDGPCGVNRLTLYVACGCDPVVYCDAECDPLPAAIVLRLTITGDGSLGDLMTPEPTGVIPLLSGLYPLTYYADGGPYGSDPGWYGRFRVDLGGNLGTFYLIVAPIGEDCELQINGLFTPDDPPGTPPFEVSIYISGVSFDPDAPLITTNTEWRCNPDFAGASTVACFETSSNDYAWTASVTWGPDEAAAYDPCGDEIEYECVDGDCVEQVGGSYVNDPTCGGGCPEPESACCDEEGESLADHPDLELVVPDGPYAGTYTLEWDTDHWGAFFEPYSWELTCAAGVWTLTLHEGEDLKGTDTDEPEECEPLALTFPGVNFSSAGDLTVSVA